MLQEKFSVLPNEEASQKQLDDILEYETQFKLDFHEIYTSRKY